jgi:hypothetical protein
MKIKILIVALVVVIMSACTQRTCPTYAQGASDTVEQSK